MEWPLATTLTLLKPEASSAPLVAGSSTGVIKGSQYLEYGFTLDAFLSRRSLAGGAEHLRLVQRQGYILPLRIKMAKAISRRMNIEQKHIKHSDGKWTKSELKQ